ncbi:type II secretion system protein GspN [Thermodesulfobacteriota bacterium B35]
MVRRIAALMITLSGYGVYTLAVALVLFWLLFPSATVRDWLQYRLQRAMPSLHWRISSLGLGLPGGLVITGLRAGRGSGDTDLLVIDRVTMVPDPVAMLRKRDVRLRLHMALAGGSLDAALVPARNLQKVALEQGRIRGVKLARLQGLQAELGRKFDGTLSGTFRGRLDLRHPEKGGGTADLRLEQGELTFRRPVLGLARLAYSRITTVLTLKDGMLSLEKGRLESKLLAGEFHGSVTLAGDPAASAIRLQGVVQPRPELFASVGDPTGAEMIRSRLGDGGLAFTVTGSLAAPGILFPGLSGLPLNPQQEGR